MMQAEQLARQRGVSKARFLEIEEQRVTEEQREAARKGRLVRWIPPLSLGRYYTPLLVLQLSAASTTATSS